MTDLEKKLQQALIAADAAFDAGYPVKAHRIVKGAITLITSLRPQVGHSGACIAAATPQNSKNCPACLAIERELRKHPDGYCPRPADEPTCTCLTPMERLRRAEEEAVGTRQPVAVPAALATIMRQNNDLVAQHKADPESFPPMLDHADPRVRSSLDGARTAPCVVCKKHGCHDAGHKQLEQTYIAAMNH